MSARRVMVTGAAGYVAAQMLPTLRERYETVLLDVSAVDREGRPVDGVAVVDLADPDRSLYADRFDGVDTVVHLGYRRRNGDPLEHFEVEKSNVEMAYNVLRASYDAGVRRVVMASSNHAADWYEHALIHHRKMESVDPYDLPLSDNFYGWSKASYEHLGFLFAAGKLDRPADGDRDVGRLSPGRRLEVVMVRIGAPRRLDLAVYGGDAAHYKRDLGAYISPRDLTQLFRRGMETPNIDNEHGVPWQVVYGISGNTRAFWSLANARRALGYAPQDDSELKYAADVRELLSEPGRVG